MKFLLQILFVPLLLWGSEIVFHEDRCKVPLLYPGGDRVEKAKISLENGMRVYIVSDPQATMAACSLTVFAGSFDDPEEMPGVAHFLEHMLFLGSKKFPEEGALDTFLTLHGGRTNAFTSSDTTSYYFSVEEEALLDALDRFSDQISSPLFPEKWAEREKRAVDQEFRKNLASEGVAIFHLIKEAFSSQHPFHRFATGNLETLSKVDSAFLHSWFATFYRPDNMQLHLRSKKPLQELVELVKSRFSSIPEADGSHLGKRPWQDRAQFQKEFLDKIIYTESKNEGDTLYLVYHVPQTFWECAGAAPFDLLGWLLDNPKEGGVFRLLKEKGWIERAEFSPLGLDSQEGLWIAEFGLSQEGVKRADEIEECFSSFLRHLQAVEGMEKHYAEMKKSHLLEYQFALYEPLDWAYQMGQKSKMVSLEELPGPKTLLSDYDGKVFEGFLSHLLSQTPLMILSVEKPDPATPLSREVPYNENRYGWMARNVLDKAKHPLETSFAVKSRGEFFPASFEQAVGATKEERAPTVIAEEKKGRLSYCPTTLLLPERYLLFLIKSPSLMATGKKKRALQMLFCTWLEEEWMEEREEAEKAGLFLSAEIKQKGLLLRLSGFHDKMPSLLKRVASTLQKREIDPKRFFQAKERLLQECRDFCTMPLYSQAGEYNKSVLFPDAPSLLFLRKSLEKISQEEFARFVETLFSSFFIDALMIGNVAQEEALHEFRNFVGSFSGKGYRKKEEKRKELLFTEKAPYLLAFPVDQGGESLFLLSIESMGSSPRERALSELLMTTIRPHYFQELRTRQQTGYALFSYFQEVEGRLFHNFVVQSSTYSPEELRWRCEVFLEDWLKEVELGVDESSFSSIKTTLIEKYRRGASTLNEFGSKTERLFLSFGGEYDRDKKTEEAMESITYSQFVSYAKEILGRANYRRVALEIAPKKKSSFSFYRESVKSIPYQIRGYHE